MVRRGRTTVQKEPSYFWRARNFSLQFNMLDTFLTMIALLFSMLVATAFQLDMARAIMAIVFAMFMVGAIAIREWMKTTKEEKKEDIKDLKGYQWLNKITWGLVGFIGIVIAQYTVLVTLTLEYLATIDPYERAFGFTAGVSEEWFFRGLLLNWFIKLTGEYILSSLITSGIFTLYHYTVYVILLGYPAALAAVFASSMVLCAVCIISRSLTAPTISHCMLNVGLRVMI